MTPRTWHLSLVYTSLPLSQNQRGHWAQLADRRKMLRDQVRYLVRAQRIPRLEAVTVRLHWTPKTRNLPDVDNTFATLKPMVDGLRDYRRRHNGSGQIISPAWTGIIPDDDPSHVSVLPPIFHDPDRMLTTRLGLELIEGLSAVTVVPIPSPVCL